VAGSQGQQGRGWVCLGTRVAVGQAWNDLHRISLKFSAFATLSAIETNSAAPPQLHQDSSFMSSHQLSKSPPSTAAPPCNLKLNTHADVAGVSNASVRQQSQGMQQCCVCKEDSSGCLCCGDAPGHFFCNECLSNMVMSQVTGEGKPVFLSKGCHILCTICQTSGLCSVLDMQFSCPHLTRGAYSAYLSAIAETEVLREQREWQQRLERQEANFKARLNIVQCTAGGAMNDPHVQHIAEQLILPRCPTCKSFISDFEACAALQVLLHTLVWMHLYPNLPFAVR